jgi:hypothetical protein
VRFALTDSGADQLNGINISMQYLMPKARNLRTGQTVKQQDLAGRRYMPHESQLAQQTADDLAQNMTRRSQDTWEGFVDAYTASPHKNA